jgi:hypothetical protein
MEIHQVDSAGRLYWVRDIVSAELVQQILSVDWLKLPNDITGPQQANWLRRAINQQAHPVQQQLTTEIQQAITVIERYCGVEFDFIGEPTFWVDYPGFQVTRHTDGELPSAMQLFWIAPSTEYGTVFYNTPHRSDVLKQFDFQPNSGYLMLNQPNSDGSQPLLWHGMHRDVPTGGYRMTTYSVLGAYKHK